ncbi:hypothetical protein EDD11_009649, partial [Mortierella claussenii]
MVKLVKFHASSTAGLETIQCIEKAHLMLKMLKPNSKTSLENVLKATEKWGKDEHFKAKFTKNEEDNRAREDGKTRRPNWENPPRVVSGDIALKTGFNFL